MRPLLALALLCASLFSAGFTANAQDHVTIRDASGNVLLSGYETVDPVAVSISPQDATILSGGIQQFTATVANSLNGAVAWSSSLGTIDALGNFSLSTLADSQAVITAAALADPTKTATATVMVKAAFDGPAELPRRTLSTSISSTPSPGIVTQVAPGGLQAAVNAARCGDTLALQGGGIFPGNVTFPAKNCDDQHWIRIRSSAPDSALPAEGSRYLPCYSGVASLPGRPAFTCANGVQNVGARLIAGNSSGPILFAAGANHYRFGPGLEITRQSGTGIVYQMISVPTGAADKIIFDRVWLHGTAQDDSKTGLLSNGMTSAAFIDSYANDFHCTSIVGNCTDAKVFGGGTSTLPGGPYKIANDFLEASGENILLGGAAATTTPADIEILHNHFFKPLTWMKGQTGFVGGAGGNAFIVKNLLELKNAQRVRIEGNIFEDSWGGYSQYGYAILLSPKNQSGTCPICQVTDVTIRYNTFSHLGGGVSVALTLDPGFSGGLAGDRYSLHDLTFDDISASVYNGNGVFFQILNSWPGYATHDIALNHITAFPDPKGKIVSLANALTNPKMANFSVTNSVLGPAQYPVWSASGQTSDCASADVPLTAFNTCFVPYTFSSNALVGVNLANYPANKWPAGNFFPATLASVPTSGSSDGRALGADQNAVQQAVAGAE